MIGESIARYANDNFGPNVIAKKITEIYKGILENMTVKSDGK